MKLLVLMLLSILLASCPATSFDFERIPTPSPFEMPELEELILIDNSRVSLAFDRPVEIRTMTLDEKEVESPGIRDRIFTVRLPEDIPYGQAKRLRFTVEDSLTGNLSRFSVPLMGINRNQADVIMTEISVKGTESSPDRIELLVLKSGTTGSLTISDGSLDEADYTFTLPDFKVNRGDTIVLFLSQPHNGEDVIRIGNRRIFNVDADPHSLLSTNGAVVLFSHTNGNGRIMDAFLYRKSDTAASNGWGNSKTEETSGDLLRRSEWKGPGFPSDGNTSTRVFARYYPYEDSNSGEDWYLTATRGSTFGYSNDNNEYVPPEEEKE